MNEKHMITKLKQESSKLLRRMHSIMGPSQIVIPFVYYDSYHTSAGTITCLIDL